MHSITRNLWTGRRLVRQLARREFRSRYVGSSLGAAWALLEPAIQFGLYITVFSLFLGMRLENAPGRGAFGLYLVSGLLPFLALQESLVRSVSFCRSYALLLRHSAVPLEVLLAGTLLSIFARHGIGLALVLLLELALGALHWSALPWLLAGIALLAGACWGMALLLVPLGAYLPDVSQGVALGSTVLFFLTPVVYPLSAVPASIARWLPWNPVSGILDGFRAFMVGSAPQRHGALVAAGAVALALTLGSLVFRARSGSLRDLA